MTQELLQFMIHVTELTRRTCGGSTSEERSRSTDARVDGVVRRVNLLGLSGLSSCPWSESARYG